MYNPQLIKFSSTDNLFLPGLLYEPPNKTHKVAIYLHGNGSSSVFYGTDITLAFAEFLNKNNISFFTFNNRGAHYIKSLTRKISRTEDEQVQMGTAYELIKDCIYDIDGAINLLKERGNNEFYLIGHSTGANKVAVYDFYKKKNAISKYILLGGGDDTGIYYQEMQKEKFNEALLRCKEMIKKGKGEQLVPKHFTQSLISYQSLYDTINPDGDYNIFPYYEYHNHLKLTKKELFNEVKQISKPTLIIYGALDEYCSGAEKAIETLRKKTKDKNNFTFGLVPQADHSFHDKETELAKTISYWLTKS